MTNNKLLPFALMILNCAFIGTVLYLIIVKGYGLVFDYKDLYFTQHVGEVFLIGLILGLIQTTIFIILEWREKNESLFYITFFTVLATELMLCFVYIFILFSFPFGNNLWLQPGMLGLFFEIYGYSFVKLFLFIALFSIIANIINKYLFNYAKSENIFS